jgi:hypothetical protein
LKPYADIDNTSLIIRSLHWQEQSQGAQSLTGEYLRNEMIPGLDLNQRPPGYEPDELPDIALCNNRVTDFD